MAHYLKSTKNTAPSKSSVVVSLLAYFTAVVFFIVQMFRLSDDKRPEAGVALVVLTIMALIAVFGVFITLKEVVSWKK